MDLYLILFTMLVPVVTMFAGWMLKRYPPKTRNGVYGYRTRRSSSSRQAWDYAQRRSGALMLRLGLYALVASPLLTWLLPVWDLVTRATIVPLVQVALLFVPIIMVERELKQQFNDHK